MKGTANGYIIALLSALILCTTAAPAMADDFWVSNSDIVSGLQEVDYGLLSTVFEKDGTWYLIHGDPHSGGFHGYNWTGSEWQSDPAIVSGLGSVGKYSAPEVFNKDGTWYLISGAGNGIFHGYNWTGSEWQSDPVIASGLGSVICWSRPAVFCMDGTWYLISGAGGSYGLFGYKWTGSTWESDRAISSGLTTANDELDLHPTVFNKDGTWYLIYGYYIGSPGYEPYPGRYGGFHWTGHRWVSDSDIVSGLGNSSSQRIAPEVFYKDETWYLIAQISSLYSAGIF